MRMLLIVASCWAVLTASGRADESAVREIVGKETLTAEQVAKQVNFDKEYLLLFRWIGAAMDKLAFELANDGGKPVVRFSFTPGTDKALRSHIHVFALTKAATHVLPKDDTARLKPPTKITTEKELMTGFVAAKAPVDDLKAFPPAEKGMVRHVVRLPKQDDEAAFQVELIAGKTVKLDPANRFWFGGKIEAKNIEGWGYTRYVLEKLGPMAGTLIGVDPKVPNVDRFVTLGGGPYLIRYNSRLPVVVYAPEGVEIRYRIWRAEPKTAVAEKE